MAPQLATVDVTLNAFYGAPMLSPTTRSFQNQNKDRIKGYSIRIANFHDLEVLVDKIMIEQTTAVLELDGSEIPKKIGSNLDELKAKLCEESRTSRLWCQYLDYVNQIKNFIAAERTGDWHLHVATVRKMINLFATTGHFNYAKRY